MTPIGGKYLADMRLVGKRPLGTIWVTDDRAIARRVRERHSYPLVVDFGESYDMRVLHGLDVSLATATDRQKTVGVCQAILEAEPRSFMVAYGPDDIEWVVHAAR